MPDDEKILIEIITSPHHTEPDEHLAPRLDLLAHRRGKSQLSSKNGRLVRHPFAGLSRQKSQGHLKSL
ncbi:hypothetical protein ACC690_39110, partial [Rhizobium johnstonii]